MDLRIKANLERPVPPVEISDEVQLWARQNGRRFGRLEWHPLLGCWVIHFGRLASDPTLRAYQEGKLTEEPTESIMLNEWNPRKGRYEAISLGDLGAEGVRRMLEEADVWSGRGAHNSLQEGIAAVRARNEKVRQDQRALGREIGEEFAWLHGKGIKGEPVITPGIDLKEN